MVSADRGDLRPLVSSPLPLGLPLIATMLFTLLADRVLGLASIVIRPQVGFTGGLLPGGSVALLADTVTVGVVMVVLVAVELVGRPRSRGAMVAVLVVAALAGLQLGAVAVETVTGRSLTADLYLARGLLLAGTTSAALNVLAALAEHRRSTGALRSATTTAESLAASGRGALRELRADVGVRVREVLSDALGVLEVGGHADSGTRLRALADEVLRPLSHRLAAMPVPATPVDSIVVVPRWRDTFATLMRAPVVLPRTLALLATALAFLRTLVTDQEVVRDIAPTIDAGAEGSGVALSIDTGSVLVAFGDFAIVFLATWSGAVGLARLLRSRRGTMRPILAWMSVLVGLAGVAVVTVAGPAFIDRLTGIGFSEFDGPSAIVASFLPMLAVTLGASLVAAVTEGRVALEDGLARQRAETVRMAARVQAVLGHEQRRLARSLHADVQATVNAVGLMLDRADREGTVSPELLADVAERIAVSVERFLSGAASTMPLVDRLEQVLMLWAGVCRIDLQVGDASAARIDADPVARELIVDLVTEACANAVVHGHASEIQVRVDVTDAEVSLDVIDDGTRRSGRAGVEERSGDSPEGGLGTAVLQASCTSFALEAREAGGRLRAKVPLG